MKITIPGTPITKKNSQRILINPKTKRPFIMPSKQYKQYEADAAATVEYDGKPIDYPVNVKCVYYMPTKRRVDLANLLESTHDILSKIGVLEDDNCKIIASVDGSRVDYDKDNPRTEIYIETLN